MIVSEDGTVVQATEGHVHQAVGEAVAGGTEMIVSDHHHHGGHVVPEGTQYVSFEMTDENQQQVSKRSTK